MAITSEEAREKRRQVYAEARVANTATYRRALTRSRRYERARSLDRANSRAFGDYYGPLLACCGQWWEIIALPAQCPVCQRVYGFT